MGQSLIFSAVLKSILVNVVAVAVAAAAGVVVVGSVVSDQFSVTASE